MSVTSNIPQFNATLSRYIALQKRTPAEVLYKKGRDLTFELFKAFSTVAAPDKFAHRARIVSDVKSNQYGIKVGAKAKALAANLMSGNDAVVGTVEIANNYVRIHTARIGKRGKRISGGRSGRLGRAASLDEYYGVEFQEMAGERVLSRRNIEVAMETMLRLRGTGSLAQSWLYKQWRKRVTEASGQPFAVRTLTHVNPKAEVKLQGVSEFQPGENPSVSITSKMPGIAKYPGAVAKALGALQSDMETYISRKMGDNARKAGLAMASQAIGRLA